MPYTACGKAIPLPCAGRFGANSLEYLLDRGLLQQAVPEIIALADSTPANDPEQLRAVGKRDVRVSIPFLVQFLHSQWPYGGRENPRVMATSLFGGASSDFQIAEIRMCFLKKKAKDA